MMMMMTMMMIHNNFVYLQTLDNYYTKQLIL